jgi:hypothetical protein
MMLPNTVVVRGGLGVLFSLQGLRYEHKVSRKALTEL